MAEYDGVVYSDYNKKYRFRVNYHVSQNMTSAVSTITLSLTVETTDTNRQYNNYGNSYWNMTGTGDNYIKYDIATTQKELYLGSSVIGIQHDAIGNGGFILNAYWYTGRKNSTYIPEAMSMSTYVNLQSIPRESSISMSTANIEEQATITITSASSEFTHSVYAYLGSQYEVIAVNQRGGSFNWTVPSSFYAQIPNNTSGTGTIYCETYHNGNHIGLKTASFRVTTNIDRCRPTVTGTVVDTNETTINLTGDPNKLVLGKSTAKITVFPEAKNSATIKNVKIGGVVTTDNTRTIANVTNVSFPIEVTDSRNYPNTEYSAIPSGGSVNYIPLTLNTIIFRPQPTTGEINLTYSGKYFNDSFGKKDNSITITWKYKEKNEEEWIDGGQIAPIIEENIITEQTLSLGEIFDYKKEYEFEISAADELTSMVKKTTVGVGNPVFNWGKDYFNVNTPATFKEKVYGKNLPIAAATEDGTSYDDVGVGQQLYNSGFYTINQEGWYNLINVRHRNGNIDGIKYGMQIRSPLLDFLPSLQVRQQQNEIWGNWFRISTFKILFDNSSGTTGNVKLNVTANDFDYLEIYFALNLERIKCTKLFVSDGQKFVLDGSWAAPDLGLIQLETKSYILSGENITVETSEWYTNLRTNGIESLGTQSVIKIYKVIGYR